jgi:hypothetical protein
MTSLDASPPGIVERVLAFVCRLHVYEVSKGGQTVRMIEYYQYGRSDLKNCFLVSARFLASLTPPPRPASCNADQRQCYRLGAPIVDEVE